jgi:hypothetical protein
MICVEILGYTRNTEPRPLQESKCSGQLGPKLIIALPSGFLRSWILASTTVHDIVTKNFDTERTMFCLSSLTLIRMTKDERGLAFFKGLLL